MFAIKKIDAVKTQQRRQAFFIPISSSLRRWATSWGQTVSSDRIPLTIRLLNDKNQTKISFVKSVKINIKKILSLSTESVFVPVNAHDLLVKTNDIGQKWEGPETKQVDLHDYATKLLWKFNRFYRHRRALKKILLDLCSHEVYKYFTIEVLVMTLWVIGLQGNCSHDQWDEFRHLLMNVLFVKLIHQHNNYRQFL